MTYRFVGPLVALSCAALLASGAAQGAGPAGPCGLRLAAAAGGEIPFRLPARGSAERADLRGALLRCVLRRRDGTLFARLDADRRERVLAVAFYRRNGKLRRSTGAVYAQQPSDSGAHVECGSTASKTIGPSYWTTPRNWYVGTTPAGVERSKAVKALKAAMNEWTANVNWCGITDHAGPPMHYQGDTTRKTGQDGQSTVDWLSLETDQDCKGALACTVTAYDTHGNPVESDTRFNTKYKWSTSGAKDAYDIQTVAAHEFGHILQFDHVDTTTSVMHPYLAIGDTSGRKLGKGEAQADNKHY